MKKILMMMAVATTMFTACKKSDDAPPAQLDVTMANIAGTYKITADQTSGTYAGQTGTIDNFNGGNGVQGYAACEKDDTFTFTAAGNASNAEGATSCSPATTASTNPYILNTTTKAINFPSNIGQGGVSGTVTSLTAGGFVVTETMTNSGVTYTNTTTFTKQ